MTDFFRMSPDADLRDVWALHGPIAANGEQIDARKFTVCEQQGQSKDLHFTIAKPGRQLSFTFSSFCMIVSEDRINQAIETRFSVRNQRVPVSITDSATQFEILNILDCVECIDESQSALARWTQEELITDPVRTRQYKYRMIYDLVIDPTKAEGHDLFRVMGWDFALICSGSLKNFLNDVGVEGIYYQSVTAKR